MPSFQSPVSVNGLVEVVQDFEDKSQEKCPTLRTTQNEHLLPTDSSSPLSSPIFVVERCCPSVIYYFSWSLLSGQLITSVSPSHQLAPLGAMCGAHHATNVTTINNNVIRKNEKTK